MSLTRAQLEANIRAMSDQGAPPEAIQQYINKQSVGNDTGFWKGTAQAFAKSFSKFGVSALQTGKGIENIAKTAGGVLSAPFSKNITVEGELKKGNERFAQLEKERQQGYNLDWFGGQVRPIGTDQETGEVLPPAQMIADAAGTGLEVGSYAVAPISKPGAGFFKTMFSNLKGAASLSFGIGTGLQEYGQTGSATEGLKQGAADVVGASLGFAAFNKGGQIFSKFGGKLLANKVVQEQAKIASSFAEKNYTVFSDWFKAPRQTVTDLKTSQGFKDAYDGLSKEFSSNLQKTSDGVIDAMKEPMSKDPDVMMRGLTHDIQNQINNAFKLPKATYASLDESGFVFKPGEGTQAVFNPSDFKVSAKDFISGLDDKYKPIAKSLEKQGESIDNIQATLKSMGADIKVKESDAFATFMDSIATKFSEGMKASDFLNTAYKLFNVGKTFPPDQAAVARNYAKAMFSDGREILIKEGRQDLLDAWDKGSIQWKQALKIADSNTLKNLIDAGKIDNFIAKATGDTKKLTIDEKNILEKAFIQNPKETQQLFTDAILNRVQEMIRPPRGKVTTPEQFKTASDFIDSFLENKGVLSFGDYVVSKENADFLHNLSSFMKTNFDDLLNKMKQVAGAVPEEEQMLMDMMVTKGRLDLAEALKGKDFTTFSESFVKLLNTHPVDMAPFIREMKPQDKQLAGLAVLNKMFDEQMPILTPRPDGTFRLDEDLFIPTVEKTYTSLKQLQIKTKDSTVYGLFDQDFVKEADDIMKTITKYKNISQINAADDINRIVDGIMGSFYAYRRWIPGATARYERSMKQDPEVIKIAKQQLFEELAKLELSNGVVLVGDLLQLMAKYPPVRQLIPKMTESATNNSQ